MERKLGRRHIFKKVGFVCAGSAVALMSGAKNANASENGYPILGLWLVKVAASGATYSYFYSFAQGNYTATGDVDEKYLNMKFSPTMGAYIPIGPQSVRYREKGWTYDLAGKKIGTFNGVGTFTLDNSGKALSGPGVFSLYDLRGNVIFTEHYHAKGKKIVV